MGVLNPVVLTHPAGLVAAGQSQIPGCGTVGCKLFSNDRLGPDTLVLQQFPMQSKGCDLVAALLDQHVQNLSFVVYGAPKEHPLAADFDDHFVQMPASGRLWS